MITYSTNLIRSEATDGKKWNNKSWYDKRWERRKTEMKENMNRIRNTEYGIRNTTSNWIHIGNMSKKNLIWLKDEDLPCITELWIAGFDTLSLLPYYLVPCTSRTSNHSRSPVFFLSRSLWLFLLIWYFLFYLCRCKMNVYFVLLESG